MGSLTGFPSSATAVAAPTAPAARARAAWVQWADRGAWAIADQGLFASSNFVLNLLLARWLAPAEYGAFALAFAVFLLLSGLHFAFISDPMLVFGASRYHAAPERYLRELLRGHWLFCGAQSLLLAAAGGVLVLARAPLVGRAFLALAAASPFVLLCWLLRRACYVRLRTSWAALAGGLYAALMVPGLYLLYRAGALSVASALAVTGMASLAASAWLAARLGVRLDGLTARDGATRSAAAGDVEAGEAHVRRADVRRAHWEYGRWAAGSSALLWTTWGVSTIVVPAWGGLAAAGTLKALANTVLPISHAQASVAAVLVPALVAARRAGNFQHVLRRAAATFALGCVLYWLALGALHRPLVHALYGGRYDAASHLLWLFGAIPLVGGMGDVLGSAVRALERPDLLFRAQVGAAAVALTAGVWCVARWGVAGAALAEAGSTVLAVALLARYLRRGGIR